MKRRTPVNELQAEENSSEASSLRRSTRIAQNSPVPSRIAERRSSANESAPAKLKAKRLSLSQDTENEINVIVAKDASRATRSISKSPTTKDSDTKTIPTRLRGRRGSITGGESKPVSSPAPISTNRRRSLRSESKSPVSVKDVEPAKPRTRRSSITDKTAQLEAIDENQATVESKKKSRPVRRSSTTEMSQLDVIKENEIEKTDETKMNELEIITETPEKEEESDLTSKEVVVPVLSPVVLLDKRETDRVTELYKSNVSEISVTVRELKDKPPLLMVKESIDLAVEPESIKDKKSPEKHSKTEEITGNNEHSKVKKSNEDDKVSDQESKEPLDGENKSEESSTKPQTIPEKNNDLSSISVENKSEECSTKPEAISEEIKELPSTSEENKLKESSTKPETVLEEIKATSEECNTKPEAISKEIKDLPSTSEECSTKPETISKEVKDLPSISEECSTKPETIPEEIKDLPSTSDEKIPIQSKKKESLTANDTFSSNKHEEAEENEIDVVNVPEVDIQDVAEKSSVELEKTTIVENHEETSKEIEKSAIIEEDVEGNKNDSIENDKITTPKKLQKKSEISDGKDVTVDSSGKDTSNVEIVNKSLSNLLPNQMEMSFGSDSSFSLNLSSLVDGSSREDITKVADAKDKKIENENLNKSNNSDKENYEESTPKSKPLSEKRTPLSHISVKDQEENQSLLNMSKDMSFDEPMDVDVSIVSETDDVAKSKRSSITSSSKKDESIKNVEDVDSQSAKIKCSKGDNAQGAAANKTDVKLSGNQVETHVVVTLNEEIDKIENSFSTDFKIKKIKISPTPNETMETEDVDLDESQIEATEKKDSNGIEKDENKDLEKAGEAEGGVSDKNQIEKIDLIEDSIKETGPQNDKTKTIEKEIEDSAGKISTETKQMKIINDTIKTVEKEIEESGEKISTETEQTKIIEDTNEEIEVQNDTIKTVEKETAESTPNKSEIDILDDSIEIQKDTIESKKKETADSVGNESVIKMLEDPNEVPKDVIENQEKKIAETDILEDPIKIQENKTTDCTESKSDNEQIEMDIAENSIEVQKVTSEATEKKAQDTAGKICTEPEETESVILEDSMKEMTPQKVAIKSIEAERTENAIEETEAEKDTIESKQEKGRDSTKTKIGSVKELKTLSKIVTEASNKSLTIDNTADSIEVQKTIVEEKTSTSCESKNIKLSKAKSDTSESMKKAQSKSKTTPKTNISKIIEDVSADEEEEIDDAEEDEDEIPQNEFIDDMAMEGEEDTPSEDSNEIVCEGESINSSDTFSDDDTADDNLSFIDDDDDAPDELLSGEETFLQDDIKDSKKKTKKKRRIVLRPVDSSDDEIAEAEKVAEEVEKEIEKAEAVIREGEKEIDDDSESEMVKKVIREAEKEVKNDIISVDDSSSESDSDSSSAEDVKDEDNIQNSSITKSSSRKSSINILENINLDKTGVSELSDRISKIVDLFYTGVKSNDSGNISLNVSIGFDKDEAKDNEIEDEVRTEVNSGSGVKLDKEVEEEKVSVQKEEMFKALEDAFEISPSTSGIKYKGKKKTKLDAGNLSVNENTEHVKIKKGKRKSVRDEGESPFDDVKIKKAKRKSVTNETGDEEIRKIKRKSVDMEILDSPKKIKYEDEASVAPKKKTHKQKGKKSHASVDYIDAVLPENKKIVKQKIKRQEQIDSSPIRKLSKKEWQVKEYMEKMKKQYVDTKSNKKEQTKKLHHKLKQKKISTSAGDFELETLPQITVSKREAYDFTEKRQSKVKSKMSPPRKVLLLDRNIVVEDWDTENDDISIEPSKQNKFYKKSKESDILLVGHPKDFKNQMLYDPKRRQRVDTMTMLKRQRKL